ncbi:MAG: ATP-binding protein [Blastocatellia bacterium]|nr:ATP-binding protein [Blastocatellia bacterium]
MDNSLIGTVKGPAEQPHEYLFITTDNLYTRIGEFVFYEINSQKIIGNITERRLARALPDGFFADPKTSPKQIAELIGVDASCELYELTVSTIGYFDFKLGGFVNPRIPPDPGQPVYIVSDQFLAEVLSPRRLGEKGGACLGSLLTRSSSVPVVLSVKDIVSTHLAILASTGAGKSYTASVLIEEMLKPNNQAAILIVDPHGEYSTLREIEAMKEFQQEGYTPRVKILHPEKIRVRFNTLKLADIRYLLPEITDKQNYYLIKGFQELEQKSGKNKVYGFKDLYDTLLSYKFADDEESRRSQSGSNIGTIEAILWKLDFRFGQSKVFSDVEHNTLSELFQPGQCTVLQLNEIDQQEQQVIVGTLLRRINDARVGWIAQKNISPNLDDQLPFPVFVLLEEAHRFAPSGATVVSTNILKQILSEGRKFGVGVGLITQRPGKLDQDVLSQCQTQFIMRIVNPIDQNTIASSVESVGRRMLAELPSLTKGQVVVTGVAINTPVMCRVRERLTTHGGQTIDAPSEWASWQSSSKQQIRQQEQAGLVKTDAKLSEKLDGISI